MGTRAALRGQSSCVQELSALQGWKYLPIEEERYGIIQRDDFDTTHLGRPSKTERKQDKSLGASPHLGVKRWGGVAEKYD